MFSKIKNVLGSLRFWIITFAWVSAVLLGIEKDGFNLAELLNQISLWLATVAGVGTLDKIVDKFSGSGN